MAAKDKILIIDDQKKGRELLRRRLEANGYDVLTAGGGMEGLKKAVGSRPDLILLDIMLPGIDGISSLRILKDNPKTEDIPVIMLTAKIDPEVLLKALNFGSTDYITKPFNPEELIDAIRRNLAK